MNEIKSDFNECCSSNLLFLREYNFSEGLSKYLTSKIDSEVWKCPFLVGSLQNFGQSLEKDKYLGLISDKSWSFSCMLKILVES